MIPRRTPTLEGAGELPFGMSHPNDTPCPFADDDPALGYINTCCSFNTKEAVDYLETLSEPALAELLHEDVEAAGMPRVATELRRVADAFYERHVRPMDTYDDARSGRVADTAAERFNPCLRPAFEAAVASIRKAAGWYEKVGRLGFGVHAWY